MGGGARSQRRTFYILQHFSRILNWLGKWMKMGARSINQQNPSYWDQRQKRKKLFYWEKMVVTKCMRNASDWVADSSCSLEWGLTQEPGYEPGDKLWQLAQ